MLSGLYCEGLTDWCSFPSGEPVPGYKPPFETELGESITNEAMQEFVAGQKRRPGFPDVWKHNHPVSAFYCFLKVNRNVSNCCWCFRILHFLLVSTVSQYPY